MTEPTSDRPDPAGAGEEPAPPRAATPGGHVDTGDDGEATRAPEQDRREPRDGYEPV